MKGKCEGGEVLGCRPFSSSSERFVPHTTTNPNLPCLCPTKRPPPPHPTPIKVWVKGTQERVRVDLKLYSRQDAHRTARGTDGVRRHHCRVGRPGRATTKKTPQEGRCGDSPRWRRRCLPSSRMRRVPLSCTSHCAVSRKDSKPELSTAVAMSFARAVVSRLQRPGSSPGEQWCRWD